VIEDPRRVLARHGLRPKKSWGQNFLHDRTVLARIVAAAGAGADDVVVEIAPRATSDFSGLPAGARVVSVTAFLRSTHAQVTNLGGAIDVRFSNASSGAHPLTSEDGRTWSEIPQLRTLSLDSGQSDGWFRDSDGVVHVLSRHLTYFAVVAPKAATTLKLNLSTPRRLWLEGRRYMAVRIVLTAPARVTGSFVADDGTVIPGQVIKTPTRRSGPRMSTCSRQPRRS